MSTTWMIFILLFGFLQVDFSLSLFFPASVSLKSEKSLYYNGENITLHCYVTKGGICNISFTYLNDDLISSDFVTIINDTYARLDKLVKEDDPYETSYSCHNDCNGTKQTSLPVKVLTEYQPQNVTNLDFTWLGCQSLLVRWDLGLPKGYKCSIDICTANPVTVITSEFRTNTAGPWRSCTSSTTSSCNISNMTVPWVNVLVTITNTKRNNSVQYIVTDKNLQPYVKPLPVTDLSSTPVNSTCAELKWTTSNYAKNYSILYGIVGSSDKKDTSTQMWNESSHTVCELHPAYDYWFEIRAVPEQGYKSDSTNTSVSMPGDVPSSGPRVTKSGFYRKECTTEKKAELVVYFEPVREEDKNGEIVNYTLNYTLSTMNETFPGVTFPGSLSFIMIVPCEESVILNMRANNKNGSSPLSQLQIPPPDTVKDLRDILDKMDLRVMVNESNQQAIWNPHSVGSSVKFYLYYCMENNVYFCKDNMFNVEVRPNSGFHDLKAVSANLYGLAAVSPDGNGTGIIFTKCVYNTASSPGSSPTGLIATQNNRDIKVTWNAERCLTDPPFKVMRTGYILEVCIKDEDCCTYYSVEGGGVYHYDISKVKFGTTYSVRVAASTTSGNTSFSDPVEITPVNSESGGLSGGAIAGVVIGALTVVFAVACMLICFIRDKFKLKRAKFDKSNNLPKPLVENRNNSFQITAIPLPHSIEKVNVAFSGDSSEKKLKRLETKESGYHSAPVSPTQEHGSECGKNMSAPTTSTEGSGSDMEHVPPEGYIACVDAEQVTGGLFHRGMHETPNENNNSIGSFVTGVNLNYLIKDNELAQPSIKHPADKNIETELGKPASALLTDSYVLAAENSTSITSVSDGSMIIEELGKGQNEMVNMSPGYLPHPPVRDEEELPLPKEKEFVESKGFCQPLDEQSSLSHLLTTAPFVSPNQLDSSSQEADINLHKNQNFNYVPLEAQQNKSEACPSFDNLISSNSTYTNALLQTADMNDAACCSLGTKPLADVQKKEGSIHENCLQKGRPVDPGYVSLPLASQTSSEFVQVEPKASKLDGRCCAAGYVLV